MQSNAEQYSSIMNNTNAIALLLNPKKHKKAKCLALLMNAGYCSTMLGNAQQCWAMPNTVMVYHEYEIILL